MKFTFEMKLSGTQTDEHNRHTTAAELDAYDGIKYVYN